MELELFNIEDIDNVVLQNYTCKKNDGRLERYLKHEAHKDNHIDNLTSRTHVLLDLEANDIVGYFTLSFNMMAFQKDKKKQLDMTDLTHQGGKYPVVTLNFFGINDEYKGQKIENTNVKYSTLLMFYLMSECYMVLKSVPYAAIVLYSFKDTQFFYEKYGFVYVKPHDTKKELFLYILPTNRLDDLLTDEDDGLFAELFTLFV